MEKINKALEYFSSGMNCAQSVLAAFGPPLGLSNDDCVKIASAFGAGMARKQATCGAVTGALMVIGLAHGKGSDDRDARERVYVLAQKFFHAFTERHERLDCRDLLGLDLTTSEGRAVMKEKGHVSLCSPYVRSACEILEQLLK